MSIVDAPAGNSIIDVKGALTAALYQRLNTPPLVDLNAKNVLVGSFFENDNCFPYVAIGESDTAGAAQWTSKTMGGMELVFTVDLWSQYKGTKELDYIADQVLKKITAIKLDLSASSLNLARHKVEQDSSQRMPDGQTMRRLIRFRVQIQDLVTPQPH